MFNIKVDLVGIVRDYRGLCTYRGNLRANINYMIIGIKYPLFRPHKGALGLEHIIRIMGRPLTKEIFNDIAY